MSTFSPVPKPVEKKKKKQCNGYKDKPQRVCYYTGAAGAERHEVYSGSNRQASIKYGFQVDLCSEIHTRFHEPETEEDYERIKFWKRKCQEDFETRLVYEGLTEEQARKVFMKIIGKNYLDELG